MTASLNRRVGVLVGGFSAINDLSSGGGVFSFPYPPFSFPEETFFHLSRDDFVLIRFVERRKEGKRSDSQTRKKGNKILGFFKHITHSLFPFLPPVGFPHSRQQNSDIYVAKRKNVLFSHKTSLSG